MVIGLSQWFTTIGRFSSPAAPFNGPVVGWPTTYFCCGSKEF